MEYNLFGEVFIDSEDIKDIVLKSKYADIDMTLWPRDGKENTDGKTDK